METTVKQYKGLEVEIEKVTFSDEDVQRQIDYVLAQNPIIISKEGPVEEGHTTIIDFEGFKDGVAFEGGKGENYELKIGSHSFIPGFEEQMVGMNKGETRDLNLTFPENYQAKDLAGKDVIFKVTVHDIIEKQPAILNDEFVKGLNIEDVDNVESFNKYVNDYLEYEAHRQTTQRAENAIMNALINNVETQLASEAIEEALQQQVSRVNRQLQQQGLNLQQYLQMTGMSMQDIRNQLTESAKQQLTLEAGLSKIAELEGIKVDLDDINKQYQQLAKDYQMTVEQVQQYVSPNSIEKDLRFTKASRIVMETAKVIRK